MKITAYILSDSIGETGEMMAKAIISQFDISKHDIRRESFISTKDQIDEVLEEAEDNAVYFLTLVVEELRDYFIKKAKKYNLEYVDFMTEGLKAVENITKISPRYEPGILRKFDDNYFRRVEAVEFAVKYDDGRDPRGMKKADIVLIGVSRTSKTPLSMYLAHNNFKVANVPLVPEVEPPKELFEVDNRRVIGLLANPMKLNEIRQERLKSLGLDDSASYANIERIREEIEYSTRLMDRIDCIVIDVSYKAIEETAGIIMEHFSDVFEDDDKYIS